MCWRVTASRHWCHGVVRVRRGLRRRGDVVWATARRSCTRVAGACWAAAWAAPRELAVQARVGTADCIAGGCKGCIRAAEQRFCNRFQQRAVWTTQWCCTRARGGRGLRDAEMHRLTNRDCGLSERRTQMCGVKLPCVRLHPSEAKLLRVPKEAYLKSHPRNTLLSQRTTEHFLQRNRRSGHTQRAFSVRTAATSYDERSRCCPGHTVIIPRRGLPNTAHKKRPLRTTPPRPW